MDYTLFQPERTSRRREAIEWSIAYTYNAVDTEKPRALLIGDSICNGYQDGVRGKLEREVNISFWATSKCVTDRDYFRELEHILSGYRYDLISFNNGLHSLTTDREEYAAAFHAAVQFIRRKCPNAKLLIGTSTPLRDVPKTAQVKELNRIVCGIAAAEGLPVLDLFALMEPLDRRGNWRDDYHFQPDAIDSQAEFIANTVRTMLNPVDGIIQQGTETGPSGAL